VSTKPTEFGYWVNANKWNDKPALICYFVGKEAYRLETTMNTSQVIEEVRQTLQKMFPDRIVPPPIDSFMTYWKLDPFSHGSYSYVSVNQRYEDPLYLSQPIGHQLLFAGEATSTDSYGYAHGALMSARREVTRLLYMYNLLKKSNPSNFAVISSSPSIILLFVFFSCLKWL
jgi:monoamine oxidase